MEKTIRLLSAILVDYSTILSSLLFVGTLLLYVCNIFNNIIMNIYIFYNLISHTLKNINDLKEIILRHWICFSLLMIIDNFTEIVFSDILVTPYRCLKIFIIAYYINGVNSFASFYDITQKLLNICNQYDEKILNEIKKNAELFREKNKTQTTFGRTVLYETNKLEKLSESNSSSSNNEEPSENLVENPTENLIVNPEENNE